MGVSCSSIHIFDADEAFVINQLKKHYKPVQYSDNYWKIANMIDETLLHHFGRHAKGMKNPGKTMFYSSQGKKCFSITSDVFSLESVCDYVKKYFGDTLLIIAATAIFDDETIGLFLFKGKKKIAEMVVNAFNNNDLQGYPFPPEKRNMKEIYKFFGVDDEDFDCFNTDDFLSSYYALCKTLDLPTEFNTPVCY